MVMQKRGRFNAENNFLRQYKTERSIMWHHDLRDGNVISTTAPAAATSSASTAASSATAVKRRLRTDFIRTLCFESQDHDSMILNYSSLPSLVRNHSQDEIVAAIEQDVTDHMRLRGLPRFVFHLFCTGMHLKNIHLHRNFIFRVTSMFKESFPTELAACYVHDAPFIFSQVFEMIKPFLNREMRQRIIVVKNTSGEAHILTSTAAEASSQDATMCDARPCPTHTWRREREEGEATPTTTTRSTGGSSSCGSEC